MLGWKIFVKKESDNLIASWQVGLGGLAWIDTLVKAGLIKDLGGNGYPNKYCGSADVILPRIYPNPPRNESSKPVIGDDYIISSSDIWNLTLEHIEIEECESSENLIIEAWDAS